jgi:hypothetical protein
MTEPIPESPVVFSISLDAGTHETLRIVFPVTLPIHDARLVVLRLAEQMQRAQEDHEAATREQPSPSGPEEAG